jgi:ABC-2 type transport system permease protein
VFADTKLVFIRTMTGVLRNRVWALITLVQPIFYLVLYGPLLKRVVGDQAEGRSAYDVFVPGLLLQLALFGSAFAGFNICSELREGVVERMVVTPLRRSAILLGKVLANLVTLSFQAIVIIMLSWPLGLSLRPGALGGVAILLGIGATCASLSYAVAMALRTEDALAGVLNFITVPVLLLSGMLLPLQLGPRWLQLVSNINPLKHAVDGARDLFAGEYGTSAVARGVLVTAACCAAAVWVGTRSFQRAARA